MQLILTHADLELALIESLRAKGMTAFEPGKASVDFSFKRGTKELQCVLDTEPKAAVEPVEAKPKAEAPVAQVQETPAPEAPVEAPAETPVEVAPDVEPQAPVVAGEDDNLFD